MIAHKKYRQTKEIACETSERTFSGASVSVLSTVSRHNMENPCFMCGKNTKYQCIRCPVAVCAICAPETSQTEKDEAYTPMRRVGICNSCGDRGKPSEAQNIDERPSTSSSGIEKDDGISGSAGKKKAVDSRTKIGVHRFVQKNSTRPELQGSLRRATSLS